MASKKFLNPINLLNLASDPETANEGDVYYNTVDDVIKVYANGAWTGNQKVVSGVTDTEIGYLDGVTSAIQTQIDEKISASSSDTLTNKIINLGTGITSIAGYDDISGFFGQSNIAIYGAGVDRGGRIDISSLGVITIANPGIGYTNGLVTTSGGTRLIITVGGNVLTGTLAEFNNSLTDANFATLTGTETLSNKTLTTPTINGPAITAIGQTPTIHGIYLPAPHNIIFEGTTADEFETTLQAGEPTGDRTITLPDQTGTLALTGTTLSHYGITDAINTSATEQTKTGNLIITGNLTVNGTTTTINSTAVNVNNQVIFEGATANGFETTLTSVDPTADNTISLPNASGTIAITTDLDNYQPFDADLVAIANIVETSGLLKKDAANSWSLDTSTYVTSSAVASLAPLASPEFTGTPLSTTPAFGDISTKIATTAFVSQSFNDPTFTGDVVIPSTVTIGGNVTGTEISYLDNVTSNIQTQLNSKPTMTDGLIDELVVPPEIARVSDMSNSSTGYIPINTKGIAGGVATLDGNGVVPAAQLNLLDYALENGPTFTGSVFLPTTTTIGTVTGTEIGYLGGVTNSIQTQLDAKLSTSVAASDYLSKADATSNYQPKDGDLIAIAALTGTSGFLKKAGTDTWTLDDSTYLTTTSAASTYLTTTSAINTYAPIAAPTFTGIVVLPSTTSIGTVTSTEIGYLDGVTSAIQTQLNGKEASHSHPYQTSNASLSSIAALAGTAGFIKFDGGSTYTVDSNTYLVRNQPTVDTAIIAGTTTFNIANAIATTLNIGGAATAITIGSNNANAETIIRTPKINTDALSVQLFNVTSTTVEFAGAATTLHIGGTSTAGSTFNIGANATASGNQKVVNLATSAASGSSTIVNVGTANDGTTNLYGDVVVHGTIEVPTPTINAQAANKGYVDALAAGINIKQQAKYATTSALGVTYTAGSSDTSGGLGEGAFITATSNGALSPDGTEVVIGERILVKDQADSKQNGIYVVTDPGDGDSPFILTRAADFNGESATNGNIKNGDYVFITAGSVNSNASFVVSQGGTSTTPSGAIKLGTDNVVFSQYSGVPGNITTLGVVTEGVWQSTRIQKEYLDDELATLNNPTFTGNVVVPAPVVETHAATKKYVDDSILANAAALPDIIPIDDIRGQFNGIDSRFQPKFQGEILSILNPLRLLLNVNGIIQTVDFPEYVWQSFLPREGFMVDSDGYIAFSEVPPAGSTFDARLMPGPNINSVKKGYPFKAVDILLGA
jgi:hypothetical protein